MILVLLFLDAIFHVKSIVFWNTRYPKYPKILKTNWVRFGYWKKLRVWVGYRVPVGHWLQATVNLKLYFFVFSFVSLVFASVFLVFVFVNIRRIPLLNLKLYTFFICISCICVCFFLYLYLYFWIFVFLNITHVALLIICPLLLRANYILQRQIQIQIRPIHNQIQLKRKYIWQIRVEGV